MNLRAAMGREIKHGRRGADRRRGEANGPRNTPTGDLIAYRSGANDSPLRFEHTARLQYRIDFGIVFNPFPRIDIPTRVPLIAPGSTIDGGNKE